MIEDRPEESRFDPVTARAPRPVFGLRALAPLRRYKRLIALVLASIAAGTVMTLAGPLLVREVVSRVQAGTTDGIAVLAVLIFASYAGRSASAFAIFHWVHIVAFRTVHDTRRALYAQIQRLPPSWFANRPSGEVVTRVTEDTTRLEPLLADVTHELLSSAVVAVGVLAMSVYIDPLLAFVAVLPLPFALAYLLWQGRSVGGAFGDESARFAALSAEVQDHVGGIAEIQGFTRERQMHRALSRRSRGLARREISNRTLMARFGPAVESATGLAIALVVWVGGLGLAAGRVEVADLIAVLLYVGAIYQPLNTVVHGVELMQKGLASARRIDEVLATVPEIADRPGAVDPRPARGAIAFENVTFGYDGSTVLRDVSFRIDPGVRVALVGATGAGKSTIAALLSRFHDPQSGRVTLDGRDLRDLTLAGLRDSIARVSQDVFLFDATVREVIAFGRPHAGPADIEAAARAAEAHEFIASLPEGYETRVGERGVRLSGGQKQRISIARALLKDAPILVLDEATSAVDVATEAALQATFDRLLAGRTSVIIAHRLSTIRSADRILVLDRGSIIESGSHAELLALNGAYSSFISRQTGAAA